MAVNGNGWLNKILVGLVTLLLAAYSFGANYLWSKAERTAERVDQHEVAITALSKDLERISESLKQVNQKLDKIVDDRDKDKQNEKMDRLLRILEKQHRSTSSDETTKPK
jgi:septal ring factor EnvC (AmiA/AmiB activator)